MRVVLTKGYTGFRSLRPICNGSFVPEFGPQDSVNNHSSTQRFRKHIVCKTSFTLLLEECVIAALDSACRVTDSNNDHLKSTLTTMITKAERIM